MKDKVSPNKMDGPSYYKAASIVKSAFLTAADAFETARPHIQEIKEKKGYLWEHPTYADFCSSVIGLTPQYVNKLLAPPKEEKAAPAPVTPAGTPAATAENTTSTPTGESKSETEFHSEATAEKKVEEKIRDKTGYPIPTKLMPAWTRRGEVSAKMDVVAGLKNQMLALQEAKDPLFNPVNFSALCMELDKAKAHLRKAELYAVCSDCNGVEFEYCTACKTRGFMTKQQWRMVPQATRDQRALASIPVTEDEEAA